MLYSSPGVTAEQISKMRAKQKTEVEKLRESQSTVVNETVDKRPLLPRDKKREIRDLVRDNDQRFAATMKSLSD